MMERKLFFFPILLFFAAFVLDKQLYLGGFEETFLRTATFLNYEHKVDMLDELAVYLQTPGRRKTLVMLGNSRTMSFENSYFDSKYKDWILFNFSVPGGTSDYFLYLTEEMKTRGIHPDMIVLTVTPQGFNESPGVPMDEVLISGLPFRFIVKHISDFKTDDLMNYAAKKMFWNYRYRPKAEVIISRLEQQERGLRIFKQFKYQTANALHNNRGSVPFQFQGIPAQNEDFLLLHAKNTWNDFFRPYKLSSGQMNFTEKTIKTLRAEKIPTLMLWARVQKNLRNMKENIVVTPAGEPPKTVRSLWQPRIQEIADKYSVRFVDMNYGSTMACDHFYDSSHLAQVCFPEFTDFIMKEIQTIK